MIKTLFLNKIIKLPTLKLRNKGRVYDKEWHMWFDCEEERQEFRNAIERAEKNIEEGRYYTQEQVEEILKNKYGIYI